MEDSLQSANRGIARQKRKQLRLIKLIFRGENPPNGAIIDYWLKAANPTAITLTIHNATGVEVARVEPSKSQGINRVVWNLRHPGLPAQTYRYMDSDRTRPINGPLVLPGAYTARLTVDGASVERKFTVVEDRRLNITPAVRGVWTSALTNLAAAYRTTTGLIEQKKPAAGATAADRVSYDTLVAAQARIAVVYDNVSAATGAPTADQQTQIAALTKLVGELAAKAKP